MALELTDGEAAAVLAIVAGRAAWTEAGELARCGVAGDTLEWLVARGVLDVWEAPPGREWAEGPAFTLGAATAAAFGVEVVERTCDGMPRWGIAPACEWEDRDDGPLRLKGEPRECKLPVPRPISKAPKAGRFATDEEGKTITLSIGGRAVPIAVDWRMAREGRRKAAPARTRKKKRKAG